MRWAISLARSSAPIETVSSSMGWIRPLAGCRRRERDRHAAHRRICRSAQRPERLDRRHRHNERGSDDTGSCSRHRKLWR